LQQRLFLRKGEQLLQNYTELLTEILDIFDKKEFTTAGNPLYLVFNLRLERILPGND